MFKNSTQKIEDILRSSGTNHQKTQALVRAYSTQPENEKEDFVLAAFAALIVKSR